mmetsp:Transcript_21858/g.57027  ORF Transcript_21858/g.57027 Transcript_21858/m.57027 type:complete len:328 (-) Transcript_21858:1027-2010(-)
MVAHPDRPLAATSERPQLVGRDKRDVVILAEFPRGLQRGWLAVLLHQVRHRPHRGALRQPAQVVHRLRPVGVLEHALLADAPGEGVPGPGEGARRVGGVAERSQRGGPVLRRGAGACARGEIDGGVSHVATVGGHQPEAFQPVAVEAREYEPRGVPDHESQALRRGALCRHGQAAAAQPVLPARVHHDGAAALRQRRQRGRAAGASFVRELRWKLLGLVGLNLLDVGDPLGLVLLGLLGARGVGVAVGLLEAEKPAAPVAHGRLGGPPLVEAHPRDHAVDLGGQLGGFPDGGASRRPQHHKHVPAVHPLVQRARSSDQPGGLLEIRV